MKALELADKLEQQFPIGTANHYLDGEAAAELRRLAAVESDCAQYLKEGETPAERIKRALGDADSLMSLYRDVIAERDALKAELERIKALPPVAWYAPALDGRSVSYFDGKPMIMVGPIGNEHHTEPLIALGSKT